MKKTIIALVALAASGGIGYAAGVTGPVPDASTLNAEAIKLLLPENIPWRPAAGLAGTDSYTVTGDPAKPGFYIVLNRFHPGNFSRPHYHANDRHVLVLSGTWWASTGGKYDPNTTVPIKAGTYALHSGKEVHYDGARAGSEDAIVAIFGEGPGSRHECEGPMAEKGPGPCAEARKAAGLPAIE